MTRFILAPTSRYGVPGAATAQRAGRAVALLGSMLALLGSAGCHVDMWAQNKVKTEAESDFFPDGSGMRPFVAGTVSRPDPTRQAWSQNPALSDDIRLNNPMYSGIASGKLVAQVPAEAMRAFPDFKAMLLRGQDRFNIFCSPCHSRLGDGQGFIAQRGFALRRPPASYHTDRLRRMPIGHFYDVMTNGYGAMLSYASRIVPEDRWAIATYIRVLQRSQDGTTADVPPDRLQQLTTNGSAPGAAPAQGETQAQ